MHVCDQCGKAVDDIERYQMLFGQPDQPQYHSSVKPFCDADVELCPACMQEVADQLRFHLEHMKIRARSVHDSTRQRLEIEARR